MCWLIRSEHACALVVTMLCDISPFKKKISIVKNVMFI